MSGWVEPFDGARHPDVGHPRDACAEADIPEPLDVFDPADEFAPDTVWSVPEEPR